MKKKLVQAAQQAERDMEAIAKLRALELYVKQIAEAKERVKAERKKHAKKKKKGKGKGKGKKARKKK